MCWNGQGKSDFVFALFFINSETVLQAFSIHLKFGHLKGIPLLSDVIFLGGIDMNSKKTKKLTTTGMLCALAYAAAVFSADGDVRLLL